ncbi:ABC-type oligopeptide transport system, periplasmic component [Liquorilactobacillus ghanensis DSM 18630]|uniref:ABC-type oligopeptide transport system, periplasmic component n=1 Tax=Liquorilactobacillus ghanensis DSM 18630 TaxID=1423750 RepID=A0A0R1VI99_9LACO|nr:peptide ABC transporter substrate-binding protein [Liquorilactobacillus ghanensis]KRM05536.1 ABC-type oligopeptide transport system, periplasmic component [Liquorilactobacillus ghanensis DSM 18630]
MKGFKKALLAAAATAFLLAGCGTKTSSTQSSGKYAAKQTLNWTESSTLATADLAKATDTLSFNVLLNTQEGLYRLDKNGTPEKALATKTKVTNGGKTYTFDLRENAKWSNGEPVTAQNFVYSWQRTVNPKTAAQDAFYLYQVKNAQEINSGKQPLSSLGIKALGKYKLQVQLTKPVSYFKKLLSWPLFFPLNKTAVEKYGMKYGTQARYTVSDGPFKLTKWTGTNKKWTLVKNNSYWDKQHVHLQKINELVTESTTTSYELYGNKKVDETLLSGQQVKNNLNNKDFVKRLPTATTRLDLNQNKVAAFKNLNIRRAISLAIDRQALTKDVLEDGSTPLKGFVPSGMGNNPTTKQPFYQEAYVKNAVAYNLKTAKQLLNKGYKQTNTKELKFTILTTDTDSSKQAVEYLQSALEKLPGVSVNVSTIPFVQLIAKQQAGDYQASIKTWQSVFADPINFLDIYESNSSYNNSGWKNQKFDELLNEAENTYGNQPAKRWQKLVAAEKVLMDQQGTIPLYQVAKSQLVRSNVKNVIYNPAGVPYDWKDTYIAK